MRFLKKNIIGILMIVNNIFCCFVSSLCSSFFGPLIAS